MLVSRHQGRVRGYLRQLAGDPAAADDLAQDTFIRAWDRIETFAGKGRFVSWLMAIAHKQFLQALRKKGRDRRLAEEMERLADPTVTEGLLSAHDAERAADLGVLLAELSGDERAAMVLSYAHGLSHSEIAEVTGLPLGTIKSHIHRGKDRIRARFDLEAADHG